MAIFANYFNIANQYDGMTRIECCTIIDKKVDAEKVLLYMKSPDARNLANGIIKTLDEMERKKN